MKAADYLAGEDSDLAFMERVKKTDEGLLPFKHLLSVINNTHTESFADS